MATTMLCPSWSVLRLQSNIITNEQTTQLAKRPICPRPPERLGALVSAFLSAAPLLTRSNIHRRDSLPAVSCNAGFCNAPEARCPTSTMLMALQKPHRYGKSSRSSAETSSLRLDVGRPDHLGPFLGLLGDELAEVGGRTDERCATQIGEPRLDRGIGEARIDFRI